MTPDPQAGSSLDSSRSSGQLLGIGEVATVLDAELGEVTVSKIRYLESRGLITPARTRGGSRRYSSADVDRLRTILTLQRRHFLPLDVIAERLSVVSDGDVDGDLARTQLSESDSVGTLTHALRPGDETPWSREEFVHRVALNAAEVDEMHRHGVIPEWNATGMQIALVAHRLAEWGIEPRHLRGLVQSADRQVSLVESTVPIGQVGGSQARVEADEARRRLAAELIELHILLVRAGMST